MMPDTVEDCQKEKPLLEACDFYFHSFNSAVYLSTENYASNIINRNARISDVLDYCFIGNNKRYLIIVVIDPISLKITSVGGTKDGEPFIGC